MTGKQLATTLLLGALSELALLGVFVFIAEPAHPVGRPPYFFNAREFAFLAIPLLLMAGAALAPARVLVRRLRASS